MTICVVFHDNNEFSGATRSMISLVKSWYKKGVKIIALVPGHDQLKLDIEDCCVEVHRYPIMHTRVNHSRSLPARTTARCIGVITLLYGKISAFEMAKRLQSKEIQLIYSNTTAVLFGYYLSCFMNKPHVWHIREFGRLDQNCDFVLGDSQLYKALSKSKLNIAISNAILNYYKRKVSSRIEVVYNDVDPSFLDEANKCFVKVITVLSCGSLIEGKGHADVIKAVILLKKKGYDIRLVIAGKGELYEKKLTELIQLHDADSYVKLLGQVSDMHALRKQCQIGVTASKMEAFGRVTIENMLSGMLVIGANSGGTSELIRNGETGFIYESENYRDLAKVLEKAINNPESMQQIAQKGQEYAKEFTKNSCANKILEYLNDIV